MVERLGGRRRRLLLILALSLLVLLCLLLLLVLRPIIFPPRELSADADGPYSVGEAQPLTFDGSGSRGNITNHAWDFGDGTTGSGVSPSHSYPDGPAQFLARLTVTDDQGRTASDTADVTVNNLPPTADAGGPYTCQVGETIQLAGTCNDPSPTDAAALTCTWADFSGAALSQPSFTCPGTPGQVTVTLTATDKDGASAQDSAAISVVEVRLIADAGGPYTGTVGIPVAFDGTGSSPGDAIQSYTWNFGDGQGGSGAVVTHTYTASDTYTVALTVANATMQDTDMTTAAISAVANQPPKAVVETQLIPKTSGQCYRFTGSKSADPDGQIVSYAWDLGDGNTRTGPVIEYCYTKPGHYTASLTVTDDRGDPGSASVEINVP